MTNSTKSPTNKQIEYWHQARQDLQQQLASSQFDHVRGLELGSVNGQTWTLQTTSEADQAWLQNQLTDKVTAALSELAGQDVRVQFVLAAPAKLEPIEFVGVHSEDYTERVRPGSVAVYTNYFEDVWRPLLGPVLSELIRELRQRCWHKGQRDQFDATYADLAAEIGVSERTVKRLLDRDKDGKFRSEYLDQFILDIQPVYVSDGKGKIKTMGTRFTINLDEPDPAKLRK